MPLKRFSHSLIPWCIDVQWVSPKTTSRLGDMVWRFHTFFPNFHWYFLVDLFGLFICLLCVSIFIYTHISIQIDVSFVLTLTHPGPSMTFWKKKMDGTFPPTFPPKRQRGTVPPLSWGVYLCHGASCYKSFERRGPNLSMSSLLSLGHVGTTLYVKVAGYSNLSCIVISCDMGSQYLFSFTIDFDVLCSFWCMIVVHAS